MAVEQTSIAIYSADILKPISAYVRFVDEQIPRAVFTYDTHMVEAIRDLKSEIESLRVDLRVLMHATSINSMVESHLGQVDDRSEDDLLTEIKSYFDRSGDDTVFPSDIAAQIRIPYDKAVSLVEKLERDGKITAA